MSPKKVNDRQLALLTVDGSWSLGVPSPSISIQIPVC